LLNEFLLLATAHLFAVASPGADFAVVIKNTLRSGKAMGLATAVGIGLGILVHMAYTLFGVAIILAKSVILFSIIKYAGAIYLLWFAYRSFQSRKNKDNIIKEQSQSELSLFQAIKQGFIVNVLNPKVTLFFVALFTNIVSPSTPLWIQAAYGLWLSIYTMLWFALVAWGFSRKAVLIWYQEHGHYIDWAMGVVLATISIRLVI
jgi:RhtB (resistance to homoserine/threonine) family protein